MQDKVAKEQVHVIEDLKRPLLRRKPAELLKLISRLDSLSSDDYRGEVADKYPKFFEGLSVMKDSYCVTLKEDAKPFQLSVPRKVPLSVLSWHFSRLNVTPASTSARVLLLISDRVEFGHCHGLNRHLCMHYTPSNL